jgi:uncharacterized DUF497 family protein
VRLDWDPEKDAVNRAKHGFGFDEVSKLFTSGVDYLEIHDPAHSDEEDRFVAIGPIVRGVVYVVFTDREPDIVRIISARPATSREIEKYLRHMRGQQP